MSTWQSSSAAYTTPQPGDAWAADAAQHGKAGTQRLLGVETGPPLPSVREALKLDADALVVTRRRLILADGQPVEIAESHYPAALAAGTPLADNKKIRGGAVSVLAELGYQLAAITEVVTGRGPTPDEAELLQLGPGEPMIILTRTAGPADGQPVEHAINLMVAKFAAPLVYHIRNGT